MPHEIALAYWSLIEGQLECSLQYHEANSQNEFLYPYAPEQNLEAEEDD